MIKHYNDVRLNSATGYITPKDVLAGRQQEIDSTVASHRQTKEKKDEISDLIDELRQQTSDRLRK
jgi:hypothetical protein